MKILALLIILILYTASIPTGSTEIMFRDPIFLFTSSILVVFCLWDLFRLQVRFGHPTTWFPKLIFIQHFWKIGILVGILTYLGFSLIHRFEIKFQDWEDFASVDP